jgi:hypothetical protein
MPAYYSITGRPPQNIEIDGADASFVQLDSSRNQVEDYQHSVLAQLRRIAETNTGRLVLGAIQGSAPLQIKIVPTNVSTESAAVRLGNLLVVGYRAISVGNFGFVQASGPGTAPDEILFHELIHCVRHLRTWGDVNYYRFLRMGNGFENIEEFYAVLVSNMYSSETRRPLRRDHSATSAGATTPLIQNITVVGNTIPDYTGAGIFFPRNRNAIALMREETWGFGQAFFAQLVSMQCDFNPVRQFVASDRLMGELQQRTVLANRGAVAPRMVGQRAGIGHSIPRRGRH